MATTWEKLLQVAQTNPQQTPETDVGSAEQQSVDVNALAGGQKTAVDPSAITQSYYTAPTNATNYEQGRPVYSQSQAVQDAAGALKEHQAAKPGEYQSTYNEQIQDLINEVLNRPKFTYDATVDPTYQQYAQQYQRLGKRAMDDSMSRGAALTGGYGNSYAQQAGQQAYQGYMEELAGQIPALRQQAYTEYQNEGDRLRDNLAKLQGQDDREYAMFRDLMSDWQTELNYLYTQYSDMSQQEYQRYMNDSAAWEADRAYWYQKAYDAQQQANWQAEFNARYGGKSSGGGSGSRRSSGGDGENKDYADNTRGQSTTAEHSIVASNTITAPLAEYRRRMGLN